MATAYILFFKGLLREKEGFFLEHKHSNWRRSFALRSEDKTKLLWSLEESLEASKAKIVKSVLHSL